MSWASQRKQSTVSNSNAFESYKQVVTGLVEVSHQQDVLLKYY